MNHLGKHKDTSVAAATSDTATLAKIADQAVAFTGGGRQVTSFSARYPDFTLDDAYRVSALANTMRLAKGCKVVGRKIGFTNPRLWDEYGVRAPNWGYIYDRAQCTIFLRRCRLPPMPSPRSSRKSCSGLPQRLRQ
jgi:hypothetical protein